MTTNCYFDEAAGKPRFLEDPDFILVPTLFTRFRRKGIASALLTCKEKTLKLVGRDADLAIAAEAPAEAVVRRYGPPPPMYSAEVNYWLWTIAVDLLVTRKDLGLLYVHTTDYPMHRWAPEEGPSLDHLSRLDALHGAARDAGPDTLFLITADHGMNSKRRCLDLRWTCAAQGFGLRFAVSPVADRLVEHHRGFGGVSYLYLRSSEDRGPVTAFLHTVAGVEDVLPRGEAASRFHLMPERIGDLVVLGDRETVFGDLETAEENLGAGYRNHGSLHEEAIPLLLYGAGGQAPPSDTLERNFDLTRWVCTTLLERE